MIYNSPHVLAAYPQKLVPSFRQIADGQLAGLGTPFVHHHPAGPPQTGQHYNAAMGNSAASAAVSAPCPTCNLVEIPYNPNLPMLTGVY
jgi:hypothetical protein